MATVFRYPQRIMMALISTYQTLSYYGPKKCRYQPSCCYYALEAYDRLGMFRATWLVLIRVLKCSPFSSGGDDPVPNQ